jgi:hypothetical protein
LRQFFYGSGTAGRNGPSQCPLENAVMGCQTDTNPHQGANISSEHSLALSKRNSWSTSQNVRAGGNAKAVSSRETENQRRDSEKSAKIINLEMEDVF